MADELEHSLIGVDRVGRRETDGRVGRQCCPLSSRLAPAPAACDEIVTHRPERGKSPDRASAHPRSLRSTVRFAGGYPLTVFHLRPRLALLLLPLAAACGSSPGHPATGTTHPDARHVVLLSAQKVSSTSYSMSMSIQENITSSAGRASSLPGAIQIDGTAHVASPQRVSMAMTVALGRTNVSVLEVLYDGTAYASTDNGVSWKSLSINNEALSQSGPAQALDLLQSVGTVSDAGPNTVDGQAVEMYHSVIDPTKMHALIAKLFSSLFSGSQLGTYTSALSSAIAIKTGTVDLAVNSAGLPVRETEAEDVSFDLTKLGAAMNAPASATSQLHGVVEVSIAGTFTFGAFGAPVTVTKPANVTGTV